MDLRQGGRFPTMAKRVVDPTRKAPELALSQPARGDRRGPDPDPARDGRGPRIVRHRVLVHGDARFIEGRLGVGSRVAGPAQVDEQKMVIGASGNQPVPPARESLREGARGGTHEPGVPPVTSRYPRLVSPSASTFAFATTCLA